MTVKDIDLVSTEELAEMDAQTSYTSPIFGSYASDVEMPETKLNKMPIEPRIASEMIREYIGTERATPTRTSAPSSRPTWSPRLRS